MLVGCDGSRNDWEAARAANTRQAYERFVQQHPKSELAAQAKAAIAGIAAAEEAERKKRAAAEEKKAKAAAALEAARRNETIPAFRRVERGFADLPEADEARRAIDELRSARRPEVRSVNRVAIVVKAPPTLETVPVAKAARDVLAMAGVEQVAAEEEADATLRIDLRESARSATYTRNDGDRESMELVTSATVGGEVRFEVKGGPKYARTFNGHVPPAFLVMTSKRARKESPPYFEAAGLNHAGDPQGSFTHRYADVEQPASTLSVRLVGLTAELFGPSVARAALIEQSRFQWAMLRTSTARLEPRVVDALMELLPKGLDEQPFIVDALGRSGDTRAVPVLLEVLPTNVHLRTNVLKALGRLRDRRAALPLVELLERAPKDEEFNHEAEEIANALEQIAGRDFGLNAKAWRKWAEGAK